MQLTRLSAYFNMLESAESIQLNAEVLALESRTLQLVDVAGLRQ